MAGGIFNLPDTCHQLFKFFRTFGRPVCGATIFIYAILPHKRKSVRLLLNRKVSVANKSTSVLFASQPRQKKMTRYNQK